MNDSANEQDEGNELLKLSQPIYFEPISGLTNVFFDVDNQQIFCVRSNGVGGVIVKGKKTEMNMSFRMEDKGSVATIKFSPNLNILAIRRKDKSAIDFLNFKSNQPVYPEYSQAFKFKNTQRQECYWLDNQEILLVSEAGFEHYQIFPEKRALKLLKDFKLSLNWLIWSKEIQVFIVSTGSYGSVLNPFVYAKSSFIKLPKFEVDLPLPLNISKYRYNTDTSSASNSSNPQSMKYYLNESDVVIGRIYNEFYVMVIRQMSSASATTSTTATNDQDNSSRKLTGNTQQQQQQQPTRNLNGYSEIAMYKLLTDSPAKKTHILKINLAGRFTLNLIDELIIVHNRQSFSSMIFDIKISSTGEFDGYVTCNVPIINRASIQPTDIPMAHVSLINNEEPTTSSNSAALAPNSSTSSSLNITNEMYSINWIMFLPNVIIDAKLGCLFFMELNLSKNGNLRPFNELENENLKLVEFLLNRRSTKQHLLNLCQTIIRKNSSLKTIEHMFERINQYYKEYLLMNNGITNLNISTTTSNSTNNSINTNISSSENLLPIVDQYLMHNLLFHLVEDDLWWNSNSKYTIAVIIEYFRSLSVRFIPIEHYLYKLLVNALIKSNRLYQLHQYLQYHVLSDSKALACLLLSIQSTYPASNQLALDMLKRLGTANDEICDVLLSEGLVLSALRFGIQCGLGDDLHPGKFLETAKHLNDEFIYYDVFKYFEERNIRLRNTPVFKPEDNCDIYVRHFSHLFQHQQQQANKSAIRN